MQLKNIRQLIICLSVCLSIFIVYVYIYSIIYVIVLIQKKNPTEEIKEKLYNQEIEINLLKEIVTKELKEIKNLVVHSQEKFSDKPTSTAAENKSETTPDDVNIDMETQTGPELPLPVPNLF